MDERARVVRDRLTWLFYAVNGVSAFFLYSVGPATQLIAEDLGISAQSAALHGTAMAAALLVTPVLAPPATRLWGRRRAVAGSLVAMPVGVLIMLLAPSLPVSLAGAFLAGSFGSVAAVGANAGLAERHPGVASSALSEATALAAWVGVLAPLLMGAFLSAGLGWRVGLAVVIPMALGLAVLVRLGASGRRERSAGVGSRPERGRQPPADPSPIRAQDSGTVSVPVSGRSPIPAAYWLVMAGITAAAGAEFAVNYWGAALLREGTDGSAGAVTAALSAPIAGVAIGRMIGARWALRTSPHRLMVGGWGLALLGFAVFWPAASIPIAATGLFVVGLGLSVLFPMLLDRAVLQMPQQPDRAMALASPFLGAAIGILPYALGALVAKVGVSAAFLTVPALMILGLGAVLGSRPAPAG